MKIFGREPAMIVGVVEGIIAFLVSMNFVSTEKAALITAVVVALGGLLTGWATTETRLGWVSGLAKALLALAVGFGLNLQPDQQATLLALLPVVWAFIFRAQASPAVEGSLKGA